MRNFSCETCGALVFFEDFVCGTCSSTLGFRPDERQVVTLRDGVSPSDHGSWLTCSNRDWGCNWLVHEDAGSGQCDSCRITRERPAATDTLALEQLSQAGYPKRRLMFQLYDLRLPIIPYYQVATHGLAFDLLSSATGERVITGHLNGVITLDLEEVNDPYREGLRVALNEPYRTMLGHFRHEIGHYYWQLLVGDTPRIDSFRAMFGDEQASYQEAIRRHYSQGAPAGWRENFISEYATMHPWEDFAECFAHYLHMRDTLQTAAATGLEVDAADTHRALGSGLYQPKLDYTGAEFAEVLSTWNVFTVAFNEINRSMGMRDIYPFTLLAPVVTKLAWIHQLVLDARLP
ncbi:zinc-binding metallopeptidase family protein [Subtercola endophyticus]|uniref:zinc-binding metallopeptidase family protein n=1 Tax=Subtercola endophyticus TaxID=2895559 RepID=UPI001E476051|nr:putative zinc-binding metallopeptidase [Subtercola endophyticus]UFS60259.1 putative zinc-binding peptidase [Subtercola endophyticus]